MPSDFELMWLMWLFYNFCVILGLKPCEFQKICWHFSGDKFENMILLVAVGASKSMPTEWTSLCCMDSLCMLQGAAQMRTRVGDDIAVMRKGSIFGEAILSACYHRNFQTKTCETCRFFCKKLVRPLWFDHSDSCFMAAVYHLYCGYSGHVARSMPLASSTIAWLQFPTQCGCGGGIRPLPKTQPCEQWPKAWLSPVWGLKPPSYFGNIARKRL